MKRSIWISAVLFFSTSLCLLVGCATRGKYSLDAKDRSVLAPDPLSATYLVDGIKISLLDGHSEMAIATGSASKLRTSVAGALLSGDLDDDGDDDAVLTLVQDSGGSGTFYYLVAALNDVGKYRGTNALLLGDRIALQGSTIHSGIIETGIMVRAPDEPMSSPPSLAETRRSQIAGGELVAIEVFEGDEQILHGWVTLGHEVRSFTPCPQNVDFWLSGASPALGDISTAYQQLLSEAEPYTPLFMTLAGRHLAKEEDGFGAEYDATFLANQLLAVRPQGNCWSDSIVVTSPRVGEIISSPLVVTGRARGTWFFEGDFPLVLQDRKGDVLAKGFATAQGEWMTKEFVTFSGILDFTGPPTVDQGLLIIQKDNPTGRKEADRDVKLRIFLK